MNEDLNAPVEGATPEDEGPSVRESLEAAIEQHAPDTSTAGAGDSGTAAPQRVPAVGDDSVRRGATGAAASPQRPPEAQGLQVPASWKPNMREYWKTLSPDVQQEVHRREREADERMRENATMRYHIGRFNEIVGPYRHLIEAEGGEPLAAFHDYLRAATLLRTAAPGDRAAFVAALVQRYNVPLDALDAHLASAIRMAQNGQLQHYYPSQQSIQPPPQPQQFRDPRLDAMLAHMEQQNTASVRNEVHAFANDGQHEFFNDVRLTMADAMDAAAKRGYEMNLEEAYRVACQIEPEVRKVIEGRGMRMSASQAARTLAAARHASASISAGTAAPAARMHASNGAGPVSVRDSVLAAIDTLQTGA